MSFQLADSELEYLKELSSLSENELWFKLDQEVTPNTNRGLGEDIDQIVFRARNWFERQLEDVRNTICKNPLVVDFCESKGISATFELLQLMYFALKNNPMVQHPAIVAAIVAYRGIHLLCGAFVETADAEERQK